MPKKSTQGELNPAQPKPDGMERTTGNIQRQRRELWLRAAVNTNNCANPSPAKVLQLVPSERGNRIGAHCGQIQETPQGHALHGMLHGGAVAGAVACCTARVMLHIARHIQRSPQGHRAHAGASQEVDEFHYCEQRCVDVACCTVACCHVHCCTGFMSSCWALQPATPATSPSIAASQPDLSCTNQ